MAKIFVLGCGMVGRAICEDLASDHIVTVLDYEESTFKNLKNTKIKTKWADLSDTKKIPKYIKSADLVINAVPGYMGYKTLKAIITAGKNTVDISFFDEDPTTLRELAKIKNITAVIDCGVAPGMSNIILGYHNSMMKINSFECLVGGLPKIRNYPYEYKAPFSPIDVIEEYTRPARFVRNGKLLTKKALSDLEIINFDELGSLESFNSDGLRSLIKSFPNIPNMIEKTLRYPGHAALMKVLRETGFFSKEKINLKGHFISPLELSTKLLSDKWKLGKDEDEFTIMQIRISGKENTRNISYVYHLFDKYHPQTKTSSMARTTGYTCTAVANLILNKNLTTSGLYFPETIASDATIFNRILDYLQKRGVNYHVKQYH